jgi:hypothetical protein
LCIAPFFLNIFVFVVCFVCLFFFVVSHIWHWIFILLLYECMRGYIILDWNSSDITA